MIKAHCIADFKLCEEIYIKLPKEIKSNIQEIELNDIPYEFSEYKKDETQFLKSKKYFCIKLFDHFQYNEHEKIEIITLKNPIKAVFNGKCITFLYQDIVISKEISLVYDDEYMQRTIKNATNFNIKFI